MTHPGRRALLGIVLALLCVAAPLGVVMHGRARPLAPSATVYTTATGRCYHRDWCVGLRHSRIPAIKRDAARYYRACRLCRP